jgi:hypothetical protein
MDGLSLAQFSAIATGRRLRPPLPVIRYSHFEQGPLPDALGEPGGQLVVSNGLRRLLESESNARIQFLTARLVGLRKVYSLANVLEKLDCLDVAASKYSEDVDTGSITKIRRLVLQTLPAEGPGVFHLEGLAGVLLFRPRLRDLISRKYPTAGRFIPVEQFTLGYLR